MSTDNYFDAESERNRKGYWSVDEGAIDVLRAALAESDAAR